MKANDFNTPLAVKVNTIEELLKWFMVDGEVTLPDADNKALTLVVGADGYQVGIAHKRERGYQPANLIVDIANYKEANNLIDDANKILFNRDTLDSWKIVSSSMKPLK